MADSRGNSRKNTENESSIEVNGGIAFRVTIHRKLKYWLF